MSQQRSGGSQVAGGTGVALGTGAVVASANLRRIEDRHNGWVNSSNAARRAEIQRPYGFHPVTRKPIENDPRDRLRAQPGYRRSRPHENEAKAARKTKFKMLQEFEENKPKIISGNKQSGRRRVLAAAGGAAIWQGSRQLVDKRVTREDVDHGALGAGAGYLVHQAPHQVVKPADRKAERAIAANPEHRKRLAAHRAATVPEGTTIGHPAWNDFFSTYPKELPGATRKRVFARTQSGRSGVATGVGVMGLAAAGAVVAGHRQPKKSESVAKDQYGDRREYSTRRAAQFGVGAGIGLWGASRSRMIGDSLSHGLRNADRNGSLRAAQAIRAAQHSSNAIRWGTTPVGPALRKIQRINHMVEAVPAVMRPGVAMMVGGLLMRNARPVRRDRPMQYGRPVLGW